MPYKLINAGFRTEPNDPTSYGTTVRLDDKGGEGECIALESDGTTIFIDIDEWPLIVEAVDKLLAKASTDDNSPKPCIQREGVSKEFLDKINVNVVCIQSVIKGRVEDLDDAFTWGHTPQGHHYWKATCYGEKPLTKADKELLQSWVDAYYYYARRNND